MFISQVIFESEVENKDRIKDILEIKKSQIEKAEGMLSFEFWWKENSETAGFSMVAKWDKQEYFRNWMREIHKDGHKNGHKKAEGKKIETRKTLNQFESIE